MGDESFGFQAAAILVALCPLNRLPGDAVEFALIEFIVVGIDIDDLPCPLLAVEDADESAAALMIIDHI